jgi:acyl carrier protein
LTRLFVLVQGLGIPMSTAHGTARDNTARLLEIVSTEILAPGFPVDEDADLFEAGLDSMGIMQLLLRIETEFGVRLRLADVTREKFSTVRKISAVLAGDPGR